MDGGTKKNEAQAGATAPVVIDSRALSLIKNEMRKEFVDRPNLDITVLALRHLYYFIVNQGGKPGFIVKEDKK